MQAFSLLTCALHCTSTCQKSHYAVILCKSPHSLSLSLSLSKNTREPSAINSIDRPIDQSVNRSIPCQPTNKSPQLANLLCHKVICCNHQIKCSSSSSFFFAFNHGAQSAQRRKPFITAALTKMPGCLSLRLAATALALFTNVESFAPPPKFTRRNHHIQLHELPTAQEDIRIDFMRNEFSTGSHNERGIDSVSCDIGTNVLALLALSLFLFRLEPKLAPTALLCGCFTALGYITQSLSLVDTSPAKVAFLGAATVLVCPTLEVLVNKKDMSLREAPQRGLRLCCVWSGWAYWNCMIRVDLSV